MSPNGKSEKAHDVDQEGGYSTNPPDGIAEYSWRQLGYELTNANGVESLVGTVERFGWTPPFLGLVLLGGVRGVFEYLSEPYAMSQAHVFPGWEAALIINLVYGIFFVGFSLFMYYGVIGALAGYFSNKSNMNKTIFKFGGYFSVLFIPLVIIGSILALTISPPEAAIAGVDSAMAVAETHQAVKNTLQMQVFGLLMGCGWIIVGYLLLPIVSELYDINKKQSVHAVLPVTLIAVVATQLL